MQEGTNTRWDRVVDHGPVHEHTRDADGFTINVVKINEEQDITPVLASLPGAKCTCPHWGYLLSGSVTVGYDDGREEVFQPGDPIYMPAGHTSWKASRGTEFVQFSPSDALAEVDAAIQKAMENA